LTEKATVHKKTSAIRGEGFCPVRTFFGQGGLFRCGRPHLLVPKISEF